MDKKQREERRRQEDKALNQGLLWVGAAILLEFILLVVNRWYLNYRLSEEEIARANVVYALLKATRTGGLLLAAACLVWLVLQLKNQKKTTLPLALTLLFAALAFCAHTTLAFKENGIQMLFLLVPAWGGLALIYFLYQREFFFSALPATLSVVGLWFIRARGGMGVESVLALLGTALVLSCVLLAQKGDGTLSLAGVQLRMLSKNSFFILILATCAASLAVLLLAAVLGTTAAYYLIFLMIAWLFALLVYYTVKMM